MKFVKLALLAVVVLVGLMFIVLLVGVDATGLGNTALAQLGVDSGMTASIQGARFSLSRGLSIQGLVAFAETESGAIEGRIDSLDLEVSWMPLLSGEVEIRSIVLESPQLSLALTEEALSGESSEAALRVPLRVQSVRVRHGAISVTMPGETEPIVALQGLDLSLEDVTLDPSIVPLLLGATGSGEVTIDSGAVAGMQIGQATGAARLANGLMEMTDLSAAAPAGNVRIPRLFLDVAAVPASFEIEIHADSVDLNLLAGYPELQALGDAAISAELSGSTGGELTGGGVLRLARGGLPKSASLAALDAILGTSLSSARYADTEIRFVPIPGGVQVEPFELLSDAVRMRGSGTLLDGQNLDFRISVGVPRATASTASFAGPVLDGLSDAEGWVNFPVQVTGTVLEPSYGVDMQAVRAQAEARVQQSIEDEAKRRLGREIGRICCVR